MKVNTLTNPNYSSPKTARRNFGMQNNALRQRLYYREKSRNFTGKELDAETGLYYYGARYLDPKTSRWISADPALGEYVPSAPVDDEAKKRNGNLPGQGGVFNYVNLHVYHYAGNNPVKYTDPDGEADWNMVEKGIKNIAGGWLKIKLGLSLLGFAGASEYFSSGVATVVADIMVIAAYCAITDGFVQMNIGAAEVLGGLGTSKSITDDEKNKIPDTLTQIMAVAGDAVLSSIKGKEITIMQDTAKKINAIQDVFSPIIGGKLGSFIEKLITTPGRLDEYNELTIKEDP